MELGNIALESFPYRSWFLKVSRKTLFKSIQNLIDPFHANIFTINIFTFTNLICMCLRLKKIQCSVSVMCSVVINLQCGNFSNRGEPRAVSLPYLFLMNCQCTITTVDVCPLCPFLVLVLVDQWPSALPLLSVIWGKEHHGKEGGGLFL